MIKIHKIAAVLILGSVVLTGKAVTAEAAEDPVAGISVVLDEFFQNTGDSDRKAVVSLLEEISSENNNLAFAKVSSYVNIRSKASEDGEILGKLYDGSACTIISKENGWYKIKSGSVEGYIKAEFLITGKEANEFAKSAGTRLAIVNTTTLKVRAKASANADVITLIAMGDDYQVSKEQDDWVKIKLEENSYGYVSADYIKLETQYEEAVSIEEEQERLEEEAAQNNQTSGNSSSGSSSSGSKNSGSSANSSSSGTSSDSSSSSLGSKIVSYALQFEGNPYVWGGTSLTNGTDCSGFTKSVFAHFGISIPRTSRSQATSGRRVSIDNLQHGDLVFYARSGRINHVAIYIGNGKVISASSPSTGIRITSLYYRSPVKAVRYTN